MNELTSLFFFNIDLSLAGWDFYVLAVLLGFLIGFLSAMFGVGGGFLLVPLLNVLLGVPYTLAAGTSLLFIIGTSLLGLYEHVKLKDYEPKVIMIVGLGSALGAILGDLLSDGLLYSVAGGYMDNFNRLMDYIFIVFLFLTGFVLFSIKEDPRKTRIPLLQRWGSGWSVSLPNSGINNVSVAGLLVIGLLIGLCTGLLGIGGGVFLIPLLLLLVGMEYRYVVGTSLGIVLVSAVVGITKKMLSGTPKISFGLAVLLFAGSIAGVRVGMLVYKRLPHNKLKQYFAYLVVLSAVALLIYALAK